MLLKKYLASQYIKSMRSNPHKPYKIVVVGDGGTGKTSLIMAKTSGEFVDRYMPTAFDSYMAECQIKGKTKVLTVCDTAGEDEYCSLRPLSYPDADVFLICYSADSMQSLKSVQDKWIPEIRRFCRDVPVLLIGNKKDICLDHDDNDDDEDNHHRTYYNQESVNRDDAIQMAKAINAYRFIECSAKTRECVRDVFDAATKAAQQYRKSGRVLGSLLKLNLVF